MKPPAARDALDAALLELVQRAPACPATLAARAADLALELALGAAAEAQDERVRLFCALERCLELLPEGQVDPGVALPALAMAAHSATSPSAAAVRAAVYEVETLLPVPGAPRRAAAGPDVPLGRLAPSRPAPAERPLAERVAGWPDEVVERVARARARVRLT